MLWLHTPTWQNRPLERYATAPVARWRWSPWDQASENPDWYYLL